MIEPPKISYTPPEDDFWTERIQLFTTQFPTYYTKPQAYDVVFIDLAIKTVKIPKMEI